MIKVGIIGCGGIAPFHLKAYKKLGKEVEVTALCDISLDKAKTLAKKFKVRNTYDDYMKMFEKEDLDLVDICTPVSTHAKIVCDTVENVPNVLVEKPMALTVSECETMMKKANKHGSKMCIGHNQIFSPYIQKVRSMIASGEFNLLSFRTTLKADFDTLLSHGMVSKWNVSPSQRGIIWEVCCHHAYLHLYFLPKIKEVYAVGNKVKFPVYDDFSVLLRTSDSRFGLIEISWISKELDVTYEFTDSKGRRLEILWEFNCMLEKSEYPPFTLRKILRNILIDEKRLIKKWLSLGFGHFSGQKFMPTLNLVQAFIYSIKKDLPPPVPPEEGKMTIALLECIEKSLDKHTAITFEH
jgi:predicted dehydrogenase